MLACPATTLPPVGSSVTGGAAQAVLDRISKDVATDFDSTPDARLPRVFVFSATAIQVFLASFQIRLYILFMIIFLSLFL